MGSSALKRFPFLAGASPAATNSLGNHGGAGIQNQFAHTGHTLHRKGTYGGGGADSGSAYGDCRSPNSAALNSQGEGGNRNPPVHIKSFHSTGLASHPAERQIATLLYG